MKFGRPDYDSYLQPRLDNPYVPDDEPVFLIRAADKIGIAMIEAYAGQLAHEIHDGVPQVNPDVVASVRQQAIRMKLYRRTLKKYPDLP